MCVAYDTAQRLGAGLPAHSATLPPRNMSNWYGWGFGSPDLFHNGKFRSPFFLNDGDDDGNGTLTHAEIADAFEATFPEIKP